MFRLLGRDSPNSLYDQDLAGFIKLNALRLRTLAQRAEEVRDMIACAVIVRTQAGG